MAGGEDGGNEAEGGEAGAGHAGEAEEGDASLPAEAHTTKTAGRGNKRKVGESFPKWVSSASAMGLEIICFQYWRMFVAKAVVMSSLLAYVCCKSSAWGWYAVSVHSWNEYSFEWELCACHSSCGE